MTLALRKNWFKSTRSAGASHCLETAFGHDGNIYVRDSKNPQGGTLSFDTSAWADFIEAVKIDHLSRR
ncbi:DUF397 domain-containing protein [Actinoplanes sp. NPDC048791]|uniref:DUF397 domain-containing protein n=1 Tax=Actinoplanes sp. NPDC048791 TaxID=3154623 RepID=UPI003404D462